MAIYYEGAEASVRSGAFGTTVLSVNNPANTGIDPLVVYVTTVMPSTLTVTPSAGFVLLDTQEADGWKHQLWTKPADPTDPASWDWPLSASTTASTGSVSWAFGGEASVGWGATLIPGPIVGTLALGGGSAFFVQLASSSPPTDISAPPLQRDLHQVSSALPQASFFDGVEDPPASGRFLLGLPGTHSGTITGGTIQHAYVIAVDGTPGSGGPDASPPAAPDTAGRFWYPYAWDQIMEAAR